MSTDDWLTTDEARQLLRVSPSTIARYVRTGEIRAVRLPGGQRGAYRIPRSEIDRLLTLPDQPDPKAEAVA